MNLKIFKLKKVKIRNYMGHYVWNYINFYENGLLEIELFDNKEEWKKASGEQSHG